jgi:hypothetical protein
MMHRGVAIARVLALLLGWLAFAPPALVDASFGQLLGPGYPSRRFHMLALDQCGYDTRRALAQGEFGSYVRQLEAVRSALITLKEAVWLKGLVKEQNLIEQVPSFFDREDQPVGFYAQQFLEGAFDKLRPTSMLQFPIDLLRVMCEGVEQEVELPNNIFLFKLSYLKRRAYGLAGSQGSVEGTKYYKKFNGGAPLFVIRRTRDILKALIFVLGKLRLLRFRPLSSFAKVAKRVLATIELEDDVLKTFDGKYRQQCGETKSLIKIDKFNFERLQGCSSFERRAGQD